MCVVLCCYAAQSTVRERKYNTRANQLNLVGWATGSWNGIADKGNNDKWQEGHA